MKTLVLITTVWFAQMALVSAQQTYSATTDFSQPGTKVAPLPQQSVPLKPFAPQGSGVIYEMSEKGLIIISPVAPRAYGYGERFLTANPFPAGLATDNANERRREFGGIKLIGFDF